MKDPEIIEKIKTKIPLLNQYYKKGNIRCMLILSEENEWILAFCKILFSNEELNSKEPMIRKIAYPKVKFLEYDYEIKTFTEIFNQILNNRQIRIEGKIYTVGERNEYRFIPSYTSYAGYFAEFPTYLLRIRNNDVSVRFRGDELFDLDSPFFPSLSEGANFFFDLEKIDFTNDINPIININMPDFSAKIEEVKISEKFLKFRIYKKPESPDLSNYQVKLFYKTIKNERISVDLICDEQEGIFRHEEPELIEQFEAILVNHQRKIDSLRHSPNSYYQARTFNIIQENDKLYLENRISRGENLNTEFKQQYDTNKREEFLETIIAFANTNGGTLYLGITDNGEVFGTRSMEDCEKTVTDWIDKYCNPPVNADIKGETLNDNTILIIKINEGENKPYCLIDSNNRHLFYVRRGSTDRLMKREEIEEIYRIKYEERRNIF